jgi:uncharacterized protein DUF4304
MAKSFVMEQLDIVLATHVTPRLQAAGFTKLHRTYVHHYGARWDVVEVQVSRHGTADDTRFTFNIGRYDERRDRIIEAGPTRPRKVPNFAGGSEHRIGDFVGRGDRWWSLDAEADLEAIGLEIESILKSAVLPYFDGTRSVSG